MIDRLASDGCGILLISSEIEEAMAMCDRILVMNRGEIIGLFSHVQFDKHAIMRTAFRAERDGRMMRASFGELLLRWLPLVIFLAVLLFFGLQAPRFLGPDSLANIVKQASFTGIIAVGMTFVLLTAGIDLSVGSNMYLSAMAAGYVLHNPGLQNRRARCCYPGRARHRDGLRRGERVLCGGVADRAVPGDPGDSGRRAGPRHRDHRILRHRISAGLPRLRRLAHPRHPDADPCVRPRRARRPRCAQPHPVRPAGLCSRR